MIQLVNNGRFVIRVFVILINPDIILLNGFVLVSFDVFLSFAFAFLV